MVGNKNRSFVDDVKKPLFPLDAPHELFKMLKYFPRPIHGSAGTIARHFTTAFSRRTSHATLSERDHDPAAPLLSRNTLLKPHLNYKNFVKNADAIADNIQNRNFKGADIHAVTALYAQYTSIISNLNNLRGRRNEIATLTKDASSPEDRQSFIDEGRRIKETIQAAENKLSTVEDSLLHQGLQIPNDTHPSSPIGPEPNARVLKTVGTPRTSLLAGFELKDHLALASTLGLVDWEAASLVSGTSFYYLKNDAALLELALVQYAVTRATARGFVPVITPDVVRTEVAYACGFQPRTSEMSQIYDVTTATQAADAPRLCLAGTAEIPLAGMYARKLMDERELPVRLVGFGRAFRAEAGARGADTRGLYRVHQFSKVELFALTTPAESEGMMEEIKSLQEEIFGDLGLCFRCVQEGRFILDSCIEILLFMKVFRFRPLCWGNFLIILCHLYHKGFSTCPRKSWVQARIANTTWRPGCPAAMDGAR